ncbi:MAG: membrane integrity-associated transporter subunit PqiC [Fibrobacteria bacterium]|nr:membrane integrity-associated transporter subunit PqiC [Fibrobacteria bacterium]
MNFFATRNVLLFGACLLILSGCFLGKAPQTRYYLLDYIPSPERLKQNKPPLPYTLRIKDFKVAEAYRRPELVYRQSAHEMMFYNFHQWAVKPGYLITDMVFKHLRTSKLFKSTSLTLLDFKPDYTLSGQVLSLEEYDNQDKWYAHIAITFQLEDEHTGHQIWQKTYDVRKMVSQHEPVFVVRELSFLLENLMDKAVVELEMLLAPQSSPKEHDIKEMSIPKTEIIQEAPKEPVSSPTVSQERKTSGKED